MRVVKRVSAGVEPRLLAMEANRGPDYDKESPRREASTATPCREDTRLAAITCTVLPCSGSDGPYTLSAVMVPTSAMETSEREAGKNSPKPI